MKWFPETRIQGRVIRRDGVIVFIPFEDDNAEVSQ